MDTNSRSEGLVDESAFREAKRIPTADVVSALFPGHAVKRRGVFCSPFREDRHPSFSPYRGHDGDWMWKDHATGESGDNLTLYRKAFPGLTYLEAVDGLCRLLLGRSGLRDGVSVNAAPRKPAVRRAGARRVDVPDVPVQRIVYAKPLTDAEVPELFRQYWRGRGISDAVISLFCDYVCFENSNRKGRARIDASSGLPILSDSGEPLVDDGLGYGIGLRNDIGGYAIRVPDMPGRQGFKTNTSSFVATFLSDGSRPAGVVSLVGDGDGTVHYLRRGAAQGEIWINPTQRFCGVAPWAVGFAESFLSGFVGKSLVAREARCAVAVLDALCAPVSPRGVAVEGMFDGLSERELLRMRYGLSGGDDIVVLNSVTNASWAAPFLARHQQVTLMLDNDLRSGAGQEAFRVLSDEIARYNGLYGNRTSVFNGASMFSGYKDLNDALRASKGFPMNPGGGRSI